MDGSIAQHPYDMGRLAIENAKKIIDGKTIPSYIPVNINLITKENLKR
jgi:ribose transport system substrate-binding protein